MSNPSSRWLYVYLRYVLKWRLLHDFPDDPTDVALLDLAKMLHPEVERLIHLPPDVLDNCLLSAFDKVDSDAVKPGEVIIADSAIIGLLMKAEAKSQLKTVRPYLAEYVERWEAETRRAIGLSGPDGTPPA
jgi:predicted O-methyltransferase YrrM